MSEEPAAPHEQRLPETQGRQQGEEAPSGAAGVFLPLIWAITAPERCFRALGARPLLAVWIVVWILVGLSVAGLLNVDITTDMMIAGARQGMQGQQGNEEQLQRMTEGMESWAPYLAVIGNLFVVIALVLIALMFWAGSTMLGGSTKFGPAFAVASAGGVVYPLLAYLYVTFIWQLDRPEIRRPEDMLAQTPSLGLDLFVFGADLPAWLEVVLKRIDLFNVWWIVIVVIGAQAVLRLRRGAAVGLALTVWALSTLVGVAGTLWQMG